MITVSEIMDRLGRRRVCAALEVAPSTLCRPQLENQMPSQWFLVMRHLCDAEGIDCPVNLFSFRRPQGLADGFLPNIQDSTYGAKHQENNDIWGAAV